MARQLREGEVAARLQEAGFSADPADDMRERLTDAIRDYNDWQTFGLPYSGGTKDQPVNWLLRMRCVSASQQAAQSEIDDERQRESEAEAERKKQESGAVS